MLELTNRCNNDCVHCYINEPASDTRAIEKELTFDQIKTIVDQAVSMGTLWFLISGGEPLLRPDFPEIYTYLKKKGLLVSIFTNASLITQDHIDLFKKYPPRDIEVTVYGVSEGVHQMVTGKKTFAKTMAGIEMLLSASLPVTLKAMVMRSNVLEIEEISEFCRSRSRQPFKFDPVLHLRLDRDPAKNFRIISQRISPEEIIRLEKNDLVRKENLIKGCKNAEPTEPNTRLLKCKAGLNSCCIDATGIFKLCSSLVRSDCTYDLKNGSLKEAWNEFTPQIMDMTSLNPSYTDTCGICSYHDLCSCCPAHSDLESGELDNPILYFCKIANKRLEFIKHIN